MLCILYVAWWFRTLRLLQADQEQSSRPIKSLALFTDLLCCFSQMKSNQIIYLDKQIQKKGDKMSNEKAWARAQRAARASYMDPPNKKKNIRIRQHNKTCYNTDVNRTKSNQKNFWCLFEDGSSDEQKVNELVTIGCNLVKLLWFISYSFTLWIYSKLFWCCCRECNAVMATRWLPASMVNSCCGVDAASRWPPRMTVCRRHSTLMTWLLTPTPRDTWTSAVQHSWQLTQLLSNSTVASQAIQVYLPAPALMTLLPVEMLLRLLLLKMRVWSLINKSATVLVSFFISDLCHNAWVRWLLYFKVINYVTNVSKKKQSFDGFTFE